MDVDNKCPTGVEGLDELLDGGFPRRRTILVSGTCGTGKTTFCAQFLHNGITKYGEPGILVSLEQEPKEMKYDMSQFGFDLQKLEKDGKLVIIDASLSRVGIKTLATTPSSGININQSEGSISLLPDEFNIEKILEIIVSRARRIGAKRVVIDSLPALDFLIKDRGDMKHAVRQIILAISYRLKASGLTTLLITETPLESVNLSAHGVESYIADGTVILMVNEALDTRTIRVRKMRSTKHSLKPRTIEFTENGMVVKGVEQESRKNLF